MVAAFICFILPAVLDIGLNGMVSFLTFVCKVTKLVAPETLDHQLVNRLPATATLFLGCKQCHRTLFYLVMIAADFLIINIGESHSTQSGATVACVPSAFKFPALAACTLCCFTMTRFSSLPLSCRKLFSSSSTSRPHPWCLLSNFKRNAVTRYCS